MERSIGAGVHQRKRVAWTRADANGERRVPSASSGVLTERALRALPQR